MCSVCVQLHREPNRDLQGPQPTIIITATISSILMHWGRPRLLISGSDHQEVTLYARLSLCHILSLSLCCSHSSAAYAMPVTHYIYLFWHTGTLMESHYHYSLSTPGDVPPPSPSSSLGSSHPPTIEAKEFPLSLTLTAWSIAWESWPLQLRISCVGEGD